MFSSWPASRLSRNGGAQTLEPLTYYLGFGQNNQDNPPILRVASSTWNVNFCILMIFEPRCGPRYGVALGKKPETKWGWFALPTKR